MRGAWFISLAALFIALVLGAASLAAPIAGLAPDSRPKGAPRIEKFAKDGAWYAQALTGLSEPYPASFRFLEDQGAWFTPFNRPGMTGPYDLRGWHPRGDVPRKD